ncbi:hypothetical protein [Luteimonas cucumeris]|nr:hypothetical protein [Luteimonas cucumeris]
MVRVNVIGWNNGVGLVRDMRLLADALLCTGAMPWRWMLSP